MKLLTKNLTLPKASSCKPPDSWQDCESGNLLTTEEMVPQQKYYCNFAFCRCVPAFPGEIEAKPRLQRKEQRATKLRSLTEFVARSGKWRPNPSSHWYCGTVITRVLLRRLRHRVEYV